MRFTADRNTLSAFWSRASFFCLFLFLQSISPALDILSKAAAESEPKIMTAVKIQSPPKIDGRLDDDCWKLAEPTTEFIQLFPDDGKPATEQTIIKVLYDNENLYFGIECLDSQPEKIDARLVPRDSDPYPGDLIGIVLDTFHDHQNAYCFAEGPIDRSPTDDIVSEINGKIRLHYSEVLKENGANELKLPGGWTHRQMWENLPKFFRNHRFADYK